VQLADKLERQRLANLEKAAHEEAGRLKVAQLQQEDKQFEQELIERLKAEDTAFAADLDVDSKRRETQLQIQLHVKNQLKKSLMIDDQGVGAGGGHTIEDLVDDLSDDAQMSPEIRSGLADASGMGKTKATTTTSGEMSGRMFGAGVAPLLYGFGVAGRVPLRMAHLLERKERLLNAARAHWAYLRVSGPLKKDNTEKVKTAKEERRPKTAVHDNKQSETVNAVVEVTMKDTGPESNRRNYGSDDDDCVVMASDNRGVLTPTPSPSRSRASGACVNLVIKKKNKMQVLKTQKFFDDDDV